MNLSLLADSAYGSGELRAELAARGNLDRVKPAQTRAVVPVGSPSIGPVPDTAATRNPQPAN